MSINVLEQYLPERTLPFLKKWFADYVIHIRITKNRDSKLGDYRKLPDNSHEITVNSTLTPQLFFFVPAAFCSLAVVRNSLYKTNSHWK